jgi:predicted regulator of Ras-like GTPase activity (Roadblock/LC7/MglB family)
MMLDRFLGRKPRERVSEAALEQVLSEIARRMPNLHWAAIVSVKGLVHTIYDPFAKADPDRTSAMAAAALSLGQRISHELRHGGLTYAVIAGDQGLFVTYPIGEAFVLALSLPAEAEVDTAIEALTQARPGFASALYPGVG